MSILMAGLSNGYWMLDNGYWVLDAGRSIANLSAGIVAEIPSLARMVESEFGTLQVRDNGPEKILFLKKRILMRYYLTRFSSRLFIQHRERQGG